MANTIDILISARDQATATIKRASASIDSFAEKNRQGMQTIGIASWVALTGIVALGTGALQQASKMQDLRQQFDTLTWSAEKWKGLFMEIQKFASQTPYDSEQLARATSTMLGFGVAQEKVMWSMKMLWDISLWNGDRLQSLSLAFAQVTATGRLMGQDLLQMVNAWFNPLEAIAKRTGETMIDVKERMSDGRVSVEEVEQAMRDATSEWWRFFNGMEKASKTFSGVMSTFRDNIQITLASIAGFSNGEIVEWGLIDRLTDAMNLAMPYLDRFSKWASENGTIIMVVMGIVAGLSALGVAFASIGFIIPAVISGISTVGTILAFLTWPIGLVIAGVVLLFTAWQTNFLGIQDIVKSAWEFIKLVFDTWLESIIEIFNVFSWIFTQTVTEIMDTTANIFSWAWEVISGIFSVAFRLLTEIFKTWFTLTTGILTAWMQILTWDWSGAWNTIKDTFSNIWATIVETWRAVFEKLHWVVTSIVERIENYVRSALVRIKDTIREIATLGQANTQTYNGGIDWARAMWWPVRGGGTYLVGERWPELFTPRTSGAITPNNQLWWSSSISINFWGVSVRNDSDIDMIVNKLTRELQLYKLWIS